MLQLIQQRPLQMSLDDIFNSPLKVPQFCAIDCVKSSDPYDTLALKLCREDIFWKYSLALPWTPHTNNLFHFKDFFLNQSCFLFIILWMTVLWLLFLWETLKKDDNTLYVLKSNLYLSDTRNYSINFNKN